MDRLKAYTPYIDWISLCNKLIVRHVHTPIYVHTHSSSQRTFFEKAPYVGCLRYVPSVKMVQSLQALKPTIGKTTFSTSVTLGWMKKYAEYASKARYNDTGFSINSHTMMIEHLCTCQRHVCNNKLFKFAIVNVSTCTAISQLPNTLIPPPILHTCVCTSLRRTCFCSGTSSAERG